MSGASALPQDPPSSDRQSHEPSMEEILASIRRIISDDQMLPLSPRGPIPPHVAAEAEQPDEQGFEPPAAAEAPHLSSVAQAQVDQAGSAEDDVLDLADAAHHEVGAPAPHDALHDDRRDRADDEHPARDEHEAPEPAAHFAASEIPPGARQNPRPSAPSPQESSYDPIVSDHASASVATHFQNLAATMLMQNFPPVDEIVRELLRPMLKTWLDNNLPVMVERLVRAEIERVARGGR